MRIVDVEQGSQEWLDARVGVLTASRMDRIITPKTAKPSSGANKLCMEMLAEIAMGRALDDASSSFMQRGTEMENEARTWYEMQRDLDVQRVGLVLRDDGRVGCSPDGLVGEDGGLEIKCPSAAVHMGYLLQGVDDYYVQIQGSLWVTGRAWWDFLSYCPGLPPVLLRYTPDVEFIAKLAECADRFLATLEGYEQDLVKQGVLLDIAQDDTTSSETL